MGVEQESGEKYIPVRDGELATAEPAEEEYLQIGDVAKLTNLTQRTLRYYEELELLDPPTRTKGEFRLYSPRDVARLTQILHLKQLLGFSLSEIKAIIRAEESQSHRQQAAGQVDVGRRLEQVGHVIANTAGQLRLLERKIGEMQTLRADLSSRLAGLEATRAALLAEHDAARHHAASEYS